MITTGWVKSPVKIPKGGKKKKGTDGPLGLIKKGERKSVLASGEKRDNEGKTLESTAMMLRKRRKRWLHVFGGVKDLN